LEVSVEETPQETPETEKAEKARRGRRKTRQEGQVSPFGEVITNFMARQRPIWTTGRVARELHTRRQTVANWVYHDITPPVGSMLEIMAKLGIPMSELIEAYQRRGVSVPELLPGMSLEDVTSGATGATGLGLDERVRPGLSGQPGAPATRGTQSAAHTPHTPRPLSEDERLRVQEERERLRQREWDNLIAQTRAVMLATGFPEQALDPLLASLKARRDSGEEPMARYIASEHAPIPGIPRIPDPASQTRPDEGAGYTNPPTEPKGRRENAHTTNH
jgi:hypothetical protein